MKSWGAWLLQGVRSLSEQPFISATSDKGVPNRKSLRIPIRVRRPSTARKALSFSPLVQARRADSSRIKGIPRMTALTEPVIFLAGRPAAERAADAPDGGIVAFV